MKNDWKDSMDQPKEELAMRIEHFVKKVKSLHRQRFVYLAIGIVFGIVVGLLLIG